ncbi:polyhydroxyalkanoate synthesis repressor PhaR [Castellaniella sp.]|uniref:polyhydroxyalkanoate synthesis repressor PhaR n=1 Tax=Castellaniella sp. TaxID=1955812 RepID=UPI00355E1BAF
MAQQKTTTSAGRLIKKYPNRRLYDTQTSSYITLVDIKQLVLDNVEFTVVDAKAGDDITRSILLQIILEEESGGMPMFSAQVLAQIIRFYGHSMQGVMGSFLERNIQIMIEIQERMAEQSQGLYQQHFGPEAWAQLVNMQTPALQNMMNSYLEQSRGVFMKMQEQIQDQTRSLFPGFPFPPDTSSKKKK